MLQISKEKFEIVSKLSQKRKLSIRDIKETLCIPRETALIYKTLLDNQEILGDLFGDGEIVQENAKLYNQKQRYQDSTRISNASLRLYSREHNAIYAQNEAILTEFKNINFNISEVISESTVIDGDQAIIQLADTHFNELVDIEDNQYDFEVAAKRMSLFAAEAKRILGAYGVKKVVLAMTGDMVNSDRRLDEKMSMATNRMTAAMLGTNLIQYFINDLMTQFERMDVVYVTGNESRVNPEFGFSDLVTTDNYDSIIFNMLRLVFHKSKNVNFIEGNPVEQIINVNGKNVLLLHGTTLGQAAQANVQKVVGKYAAKGTIVDYALFGHVHFCNITDLYARSGSLVGSNTYSDYGLGLASKASQNVHLIRKNGTINNFRIELQNTDDVKGYPIQKDLDAYNAKSSSKAYKNYKVIAIEQF
jgi:predicted phosphodiesterase